MGLWMDFWRRFGWFWRAILIAAIVAFASILVLGGLMCISALIFQALVRFPIWLVDAQLRLPVWYWIVGGVFVITFYLVTLDYKNHAL